MARALTAILLLAGTLAAAIALLYTSTAFSLLGIDPLALNVVNGSLDRAALQSTVIKGLSFNELEIAHFLDVKALVGGVRLALAVLVVALAIIAWRWRSLIRSGATWAFGIFVVATASIVACYGILGYVRTSDLLHSLFFTPGSYVFPHGTLMAALYTNDDMTAGTLFVISVWGLLLALMWMSARLFSAKV